MTKFNKFARGSGCFNCESCGRKTRDTGVASLGMKICADCYEIAGYDNEVADGGMSNEEALSIVARHLENIIAKGGNVEKVKAECAAIIFDEEVVA